MSPTNGGYDESLPMTDLVKFPNAVPAVWSSGYPTIAPSGWHLPHRLQWGGWEHSLAMAVLKGRQLRVFRLDAAGLKVVLDWKAVTDKGRLRVAVQGPDGDLYIATDSATGSIFKIDPA